MYAKAHIDETIWRWGNQPEQLEILDESCQDAYEVIEIYGVTAFSGEAPPEIKTSYTSVRNLMLLGFSVYVTPLNSTPEHRTVEFPKPITPEMVVAWNQVWQRATAAP